MRTAITTTILIINPTHTNRNVKKILITFILVFVAGMVSAQTYSKELEKAAKNGDPVAQKDLGVCYLYGYGTETNYKKAYKWLLKAAEQGNADAMYYIGWQINNKRGVSGGDWFSWYEKAANLGQENAIIYMAYNRESWAKEGAEKGNKYAQYEFSKEVNSKQERIMWLQKAADQGHEQAIWDLAAIREQEVKDSLEQDRIEKERLRKEEEERIIAKRKWENDSIAVAEGRKLPTFDMIKQMATIIPLQYGMAVYDQSIIANNNQYVREIRGLSMDAPLYYYWRDKLDGLDKELYLKSEKYKSQLEAFKKNKDHLYAYQIELGKRPYIDYPPYTDPHFEANGFSFNMIFSYSLGLSSISNSHLMFRDQIMIPIQKNCVIKVTESEQTIFFGCNDLNKLKYIRDNIDNISLVITFRSGKTMEGLYQSSYSGEEYLCTFCRPENIYLYETKTGEAILDLTSNLRKLNTQAAWQQENQIIKSDQAKNARQRAEYQRKQKTKKHHSVPIKERCSLCLGFGYIDSTTNGVKHRNRCALCYGLGYTEEHYY